MQTLIDFLSANPWLNFLFLILAVGSIIISIILYLRSRKEKILVYVTRSFNLIHNSVVKVPGLSIKYEGNTLDALTLTKIAFWNNGKGTINSNDIAPTDNLAIFPNEDILILEAAITYKSRESNNFSVAKKGNSVAVNFDYIDFHQGVIIDVYHTGQTDKSLLIKGTVKGGHEVGLGTIPKYYLLEKILQSLDKLKPLNIFLRTILALVVLILTITILPMLIIMLADTFYKVFNKLPAEFDLSTKK